MQKGTMISKIYRQIAGLFFCVTILFPPAVWSASQDISKEALQYEQFFSALNNIAVLAETLALQATVSEEDIYSLLGALLQLGDTYPKQNGPDPGFTKEQQAKFDSLAGRIQTALDKTTDTRKK